MNNKPLSLSIADGSLVIETMTKTAEELLKEGYVQLDNKSLSQFSPVIRLIEEFGLQKWGE